MKDSFLSIFVVNNASLFGVKPCDRLKFWSSKYVYTHMSTVLESVHISLYLTVSRYTLYREIWYFCDYFCLVFTSMARSRNKYFYTFFLFLGRKTQCSIWVSSPFVLSESSDFYLFNHIIWKIFLKIYKRRTWKSEMYHRRYTTDLFLIEILTCCIKNSNMRQSIFL